MQLIRKRLKVEFWLDDQLRLLYEIKVIARRSSESVANLHCRMILHSTITIIVPAI